MKIKLSDEQRKAFAELGRIGGKKRAKKLSAERRKAIAETASKAAAEKRRKAAKHGS